MHKFIQNLNISKLTKQINYTSQIYTLLKKKKRIYIYIYIYIYISTLISNIYRTFTNF
ncbi:MAG: hypothetical protein N7Q72_01505 [Spiroplasma sp. Tabriz.8]|nr:hypothetical protein [Spiroplasma sp. Tabriz.8]